MPQQTIFYPSIGEASVDTSYQNNCFTVGWGGSYNVCYHAENVARVNFVNGFWHVQVWNRKQNEYIPVHPDFAQELIEGILSNTVLFDKLQKNTKDSLKRLEKSVPRLKSEYEGAKATQEALKNNDWSKIILKENEETI